jgi:hypothetical protein
LPFVTPATRSLTQMPEPFPPGYETNDAARVAGVEHILIDKLPDLQRRLEEKRFELAVGDLSRAPRRRKRQGKCVARFSGSGMGRIATRALSSR